MRCTTSDWRRSVLTVCLLAPLLACGGLPDFLLEEAASTKERISEVEQEIEKKRGQLTARLASAEYLREYAERESWERRFAEAGAELADARATFESKVEPLLDQNEAETEGALREVLDQVQGDVRRASTLSGEPARRAEYLAEVSTRGGELLEKASAGLVTLAPQVDAAAERADAAAADYPAKAEDLAGRVAGIRKAQQRASAARARGEAELGGLSSGEADLAVLGDAIAEIDDEVGVSEAASSDLTTRTEELYRSYSKTLIDMRESYVAVVGRTSWNEAYDFPTEHEYKYRRDIDAETAAALAEWGDKTLAVGSRPNVPSAVWSALAINPGERLPRGDNAAEFWLDDIESRYFHRYMVVEGDQNQEGDWVEVDEALYAAHYEDLGMDILAKPYGMYEDEVLTQATPPGMAYVGDPRYGKWEQDAKGERRWAWGNNFLFYYLLFGGRGRHHYYYNDWDRWRGGYRGSRAYYGGGGDGGGGDGGGGDRKKRRYGTAGALTVGSSRYANSSFGRSGGFKRQDTSFRGAGPRSRGGGGGRRGK